MELKRGDRVRVQREIVNKFIALSFQFLSPSTKKKLNIPRCSCVRTAEKCTKKSDARAAGAVVLLAEAYCVLGVLLAVAVVVS